LSNSSKYHFGKALYVLVLIESLQSKGVAVQKLINKSKLRYFQLDDPERMVPISAIYDFFEIVQKDQGIDNMGLSFYSDYTLEAIGAYGELLATSKKVLPGVLNALKYEKENLTNDNCNFKILDGKRSFYGNHYGTESCKGQDFLNDIDLCLMLDFIKNATEANWAPYEIHLRGNNTALIEKIFPKNTPKIMTNKDQHGLVFDTACLSNSIISSSHGNINLENLQTAPNTLTAKIEYLFDTYSNHYLPGLNEVSAIFDTSSSHLKRYLADEGVTFSMLLERWRFMKAIDLLSNSTYKIMEISEQLFYSNSSNFIRAFKRWTGFNPNAIRE
jgi:AraC-like DNA-binding protein